MLLVSVRIILLNEIAMAKIHRDRKSKTRGRDIKSSYETSCV